MSAFSPCLGMPPMLQCEAVGRVVLAPHERDGFAVCRVLAETGAGRCEVEGQLGEQADDKPHRWTVNTSECRPLNEGTLADPDDLLDLTDYSHAALLHALRLRHLRQEPYTNIGPVLVSMNPCTDLGCFSPATMRRHLQGDTPAEPHIYATVNRALSGTGSSAILVTGESGAGKTEAVKAMLSYSISRQGAKHGRVCDVLVGSNHALEAFGNARTLLNGNSSRFGKLTEVQLNARTGQAEGAAVVPYMLEASRVTHHSQGEMNFHIFYVLRDALQAAAEDHGRAAEWECWGFPPSLWSLWRGLAECAQEAGLAQSPYLSPVQPPDSARQQTPLQGDLVGPGRFEDIAGSMRAVGLTDDEVFASMQVVLAVALFGNLTASVILGDASGPLEGSKRGASLGGRNSLSPRSPMDTCGDIALRKVAALLHVPAPELRSFLGTRTTEGPCGGERIEQPRSAREATTLRDSVARELYTALFGWLVRRVGTAAAAAAPMSGVPAVGGGACGSSGFRRLAVLDIYGFEVCQVNGLDQLLINYCNERLQLLFNAQMFAQEAREYEAEGLPADLWRPLCKVRALPALVLLDGADGDRKAPGLFALVDDESRCRFNEGSDTALRSKMEATFNNSPAYRSARNARKFTVSHFAGEVVYDSRGFVEANANAARGDILLFLSTWTASAFLQRVLGRRVEEHQQVVKVQGQDKGRRRQLFGRTTVQAFRSELDKLISSLEKEATQCHYVRCIKPNLTLRPSSFDGSCVLRQCRYSGLLETVQIRQYGYPHRMSFFSFVERYAPVFWPRDIAPKAYPRGGLNALPSADLRAWSSSIGAQACAILGVDDRELIAARTKVLMRPGPYRQLEALLDVRAGHTVRFQAMVRRGLARMRFKRLRWRICRVQARFRGSIARKLLHIKRCVVRVQALFRGRRLRRRLRILVWAAEVIQRAARQFLHSRLRDRKECIMSHYLRRAQSQPDTLHAPLACVTRSPTCHTLGVPSKENQPPASPRDGLRNVKKQQEALAAQQAQQAEKRAMLQALQAKKEQMHDLEMEAVQERLAALSQYRMQMRKLAASPQPHRGRLSGGGSGNASTILGEIYQQSPAGIGGVPQHRWQSAQSPCRSSVASGHNSSHGSPAGNGRASFGSAVPPMPDYGLQLSHRRTASNGSAGYPTAPGHYSNGDSDAADDSVCRNSCSGHNDTTLTHASRPSFGSSRRGGSPRPKSKGPSSNRGGGSATRAGSPGEAPAKPDSSRKRGSMLQEIFARSGRIKTMETKLAVGLQESMSVGSDAQPQVLTPGRISARAASPRPPTPPTVGRRPCPGSAPQPVRSNSATMQSNSPSPRWRSTGRAGITTPLPRGDATGMGASQSTHQLAFTARQSTGQCTPHRRVGAPAPPAGSTPLHRRGAGSVAQPGRMLGRSASETMRRRPPAPR